MDFLNQLSDNPLLMIGLAVGAYLLMGGKIEGILPLLLSIFQKKPIPVTDDARSSENVEDVLAGNLIIPIDPSPTCVHDAYMTLMHHCMISKNQEGLDALNDFGSRMFMADSK